MGSVEATIFKVLTAQGTLLVAGFHIVTIMTIIFSIVRKSIRQFPIAASIVIGLVHGMILGYFSVHAAHMPCSIRIRREYLETH